MNDDDKVITLDYANMVLDLFSTVPLPDKDIYNDWDEFCSHGAVTANYAPYRGSQEYVSLQKSHLKLLIYAFVENFEEIFKIVENVQRISGVRDTLGALLVEEIDTYNIVPAANSISIMKKLIKPANM